MARNGRARLGDGDIAKTGLSSTVVLDPKERGGSGKDLRPIAKLVDAKTKSAKEICFPNTVIISNSSFTLLKYKLSVSPL